MKKRRAYKRKPVKPLYKKKWFWYLLFTILLIGAIAYLLFYSPIFKVEEVSVIGGDQGISQKIETSKSIFLIPLADIRRGIIDESIDIRKVSTKRILPNKIEILIEKRKPVAIWCHQECYFIDKEGVIFGEAEEPFKLGIIRGGRESKRPLTKEEISFILELHQGIKDVVNVKEFHLKEEEVRVLIKEKWIIKVTTLEKASIQAEKLRLILKEKISEEERQNLEYIDLRFENSVYYR